MRLSASSGSRLEGKCAFVHVTLVPYLHKAGEVKTKPTQHSVAALREIGIIPDILICRTEKHLEKDVRRKLSLFCNVDKEAVIEALDAPTQYMKYLWNLQPRNDTVILDYLGLRAGRRDLKPWRDYVDRVTGAKNSVEIGIVGKYSELLDAYKSIHEALDHAGSMHSVKVNIRSISAEEIEKQGAERVLGDLDGVLVPGGFGSRGLDGKINAVRYAREKRIPFLGICLGMQMAVIEFARNVLKLEHADSTENHPDTPYPVIHLMEEQKRY